MSIFSGNWYDYPQCYDLAFGADTRLVFLKSTLERHRANLMAKLDVQDVAGLTRIALEHGLIFIDE